jgi:Cof subfamily protein (haloacid dehalogenase superfamily)
MGAYDGYYLYCDLDGTLLNDEKQISNENSEAIRSFVERGGRFGVATGRVPGIIGAIERDLPVCAPCILFNGAGLYDLPKKRFLATRPLDRALSEQVAARVLEERSDACIQVFTDEGIFEINPNQRDDPQTIFERIQLASVPMESIEGPVLKILIAHTSPDIDSILRAIERESYFDQFSVFRSSDRYLEFVAAGVSKGTALEDIRTRCADVKKVLAIGDYHNDLDLVTLADIGGAPANAIREVKSAADIVLRADNNHSCVARFLEAALS